jgi:hypothetical protein
LATHACVAPLEYEHPVTASTLCAVTRCPVTTVNELAVITLQSVLARIHVQTPESLHAEHIAVS